MGYRLHTANRNYSSWSLRPWVLMRVLGIGFEEEQHLFAPGSNRAAFRAFAPNGTVPCLHDGDAVVWDSLAIVEYLAERHGGVWPADAAARAWARCAAAEMHGGFSALRNACSMNCGLRVRLHAIGPGLAQDIARIDELWCEGLARFGGPFLGGAAFTAVDAFFAPVAFRAQGYGLAFSAPAAGYVARLLALAPMREWYDAALLETAREPGHEAEAAAAGTITADLRATAADA
jgi:glutathione S-transferase